MSYRKYPIIYHNEEFLLSIKEAILKTLFKAYRFYSLQVERVLAFRNHISNHCVSLLDALSKDVNSTRRDNLEQLYSIIGRSVDKFNSLQYFKDELDWLSKNINKSDEGALETWFETANSATNYENHFQEMISFFLKVSKLYVETSVRYKRTL